ncbi:MAG: hypothetical protein M0R80_02890 [Proteobacteria bacterium]|nr:hypothetical protein [Pseudomonadota bacterium]
MGFIGKSKDPTASYDLATQLFLKTESRGEDATGIWGTEPGNGKIIYHKEPVKVKEFVTGDMWKRVRKLNPDLLLMHARAASSGVGSPKVNKNNHPFVSKDCTTALIHNGRIPDVEYGQLKKQYAVESDCDSEMFLRVFEHGSGMAHGIQDIWSYMHRSHMAIAIGERIAQSRRLWLFRNTHRPLWLTDMRSTLGQIFFFSDPDIWDEATAACKNVWNYLGKIKLFNLTTEMIWCFNSDAKGQINLQKFKICVKDNTPWQTKKEKLEIRLKGPDSKVEIITGLNEKDELPEKQKPVVVAPFSHAYQDEEGLFTDTSDNKKNLEKLSEQIKAIELLLNDVSTATENLVWENTIDGDDFLELFTSLSNVDMELQGTLRLLEDGKR